MRLLSVTLPERITNKPTLFVSVLLTYINRPMFLPGVLSATNSSDERVACAALQLLSYVVHYFTRYGYEVGTKFNNYIKNLRVSL